MVYLFFDGYFSGCKYHGLQSLSYGITAACLFGSFVCVLYKSTQFSRLLLVLGWIGACIPLIGYGVSNFPWNIPSTAAPALIDFDLQSAEKVHAFRMLREIEGTFAMLSFASLLTLPIYFVVNVARANKYFKIRGIVICILIGMAILYMEILRFEIRVWLDWFDRAEVEQINRSGHLETRPVPLFQ